MSVALALLVVSVFINYVDRGNLSIRSATAQEWHLGLTARHSAFVIFLDIYRDAICMRLVR
jgi:hypothetical protein